MNEFNHFKNFILNGVKENFKADGHVAPAFIMITSENIFKVIPIYELQHIGKDNLSTLLKSICNQERPKLTAYVSEANLIKMKGEEADKFLNNKFKTDIITPSNHPNKEDVVVITLCSDDGIRNNIVYKVIDNTITKPSLELMEDFDATQSDGLFSHLI